MKKNTLRQTILTNTLAEIYELLISERDKTSKTLTETERIFENLAGKAINHSHKGLLLITEYNSSGDAVILIRSAFEVSVIRLYLREFPNDIGRYKAYSKLVELRNFKEALDFARPQLSAKEVA